MICATCNSFNDDASHYCSTCGKATTYAGKSNNNNLIAVWLYAGYLVFMDLFYRFFNYAVMPIVLKNSDGMGSVSEIYASISTIYIFIELVVLGIIIAIIKNTSARIAVAMVGSVSLLMFIVDRMQSFVR